MKKPSKNRENSINYRLFLIKSVKNFIRYFDINFDRELPLSDTFKEWTKRSLIWIINRFLTGLPFSFIFSYFLKFDFTIYSVFAFGLVIYCILEFKRNLWR